MLLTLFLWLIYVSVLHWTSGSITMTFQLMRALTSSYFIQTFWPPALSVLYCLRCLPNLFCYMIRYLSFSYIFMLLPFYLILFCTCILNYYYLSFVGVCLCLFVCFTDSHAQYYIKCVLFLFYFVLYYYYYLSFVFVCLYVLFVCLFYRQFCLSVPLCHPYV